jgi:hypothetical protein
MKKLFGMLIVTFTLGTATQANTINSSFMMPNSIKITNKSGKNLTVTRTSSGGVIQKGQNSTANYTIKNGKSISLPLRNYSPYGGPVMEYSYRKNYNYKVSQGRKSTSISPLRGNVITVGPKLNLSYSRQKTAAYGGIMPMSTALGVSARPIEGTALIS